MGKASRRKRETREKQASLPRRQDPLPGPPADEREPWRWFLDEAGLCRIPPSPALWDHLEAVLPQAYVQRLDRVMVARERGDMSVDPYKLMWETAATAKATYGWVASITEAWLCWVEEVGAFKGRVLDLGCGMGVHTCYYAWRHPDAEVVGVDRSRPGIDRARELAAELGLNNVRFIQADLAALDPTKLGGPFDTVVASTFLVDADPGMLRGPDADPWSIRRSIEIALATSRSDNVDRIAHLLADGGQYLGLERAPHAPALAVWLGALNRARIHPQVVGPLTVGSPGDTERVPAVLGIRDGAADTVELEQLVRALGSEELAAEDALAADPPVKRLWGREIHVEDDYGEGRTRFEVLERASGAVVTWLATSRGYRELTPQTSEEQAIRAAEGWVSGAKTYDPSVVDVVELEAGSLDDAAEDDGSLVPYLPGEYIEDEHGVRRTPQD